jgi:hypothetical protein
VRGCGGSASGLWCVRVVYVVVGIMRFTVSREMLFKS